MLWELTIYLSSYTLHDRIGKDHLIVDPWVPLSSNPIGTSFFVTSVYFFSEYLTKSYMTRHKNWIRIYKKDGLKLEHIEAGYLGVLSQPTGNALLEGSCATNEK